MIWIALLIGFTLGWISRIVFKYYKNIGKLDRSKLDRNYVPDTFYDIKSCIRSVVLKSRPENLDFMLNFSVDQETLLQVLHRVHYPELSRYEDDLSYGLAIYIPVSDLNTVQKKELDRLLNLHANSSIEDSNHDYYVIDGGERIKYVGELITLILKKVFTVREDDLKTEVFIGDRTPYRTPEINFKNLPSN